MSIGCPKSKLHYMLLESVNVLSRTACSPLGSKRCTIRQTFRAGFSTNGTRLRR
jgi:hypothetical protein